MKKRVLSLLMSFILLVNLLPAAARAAENITVYATVSDRGSIACENGALVADVPVTVETDDGTATVDAVLAELHEMYGKSYTGGSYVTKLWDVSTSNCLFFVNEQALQVGVSTDVVHDGDRLTASINRDDVYYSDWYTCFDRSSVTVGVGDDITLTLKGYQGMGGGAAVPVSSVSVSVMDMCGASVFGEAMTDAAGAATLRFDAPGTYCITANGTVRDTVTAWSMINLGGNPAVYGTMDYTTYDSLVAYTDADYGNGPYPADEVKYVDFFEWLDDQDSYYALHTNQLLADCPTIAPVCVVTVGTAEERADWQVMQSAKDGLTWEQLSHEPQDAVTSALTLPDTLNVDGKTVSVGWQSSNAALGIGDGYTWVDRPAAEDASVRLTASLVYETAQDTKVFPLTIKAEGVNDAKESVVGFKPLMDGIAAAQRNSTDAWMVLDMAGYGQDVRAGDYGWSSTVAKTLAQAATGGDTSALIDELKTFDVNGAYAIYTTPYVLLAYDAAGAVEDESFICTRAAMKASMIAFLNDLDGNDAGVDAMAPLLAALAPYYEKGDAALDAAVRAGVTWLSAQQNDDGTYSYYGTKNANSAALAVVSLSALGIDAHRDSRFIKDGHSAVEGLMSFALSGKTGFGYKGNVTENALATEQGLRALVSYARFAESGGKPYNIYLQAKAGEDAPADPKITTTVKPQPVTPTDKSISVSVRVSGDTGVWLSTRVSVRSGVSVYDVLTSVLADNGYSWEGSSHYISYITNPDGVRLGEFSTGDNSGWLYKVNGVLPGEPLGEYILESNASIVFYYTNDWTKDPDAGKWSSGQTTDSKAADKVDQLIDAIGTVTPERADAIRAARAAYDALSAVQKKLIENYDALLAAEKALAAMQSGGLPFADVKSGAWYADAVKYAYEKGLMNGVSAAAFAPDGTATRGQIVTILYRLAGSPSVGGFGFADVDGSAWYAPAVAWASANNIVTGYDNGSFGPDDEVTREQLAVILYRYVKRQGQGFTGLWYFPLNFGDAAAVSSWADEAMHWCVMKGILSGTDQSMLEPGATATRAQIAAILQRFCELPQETGKSEAERAMDGAAACLAAAVPAPRYGSIGGEWTVIALSRAGAAVKENYFTDYYAALERTVRESAGVLSERKYTEYSRVILALSALGKDARDIAGYDLTLALGDYEKTTAQGVNGAIYALLALDSREYPMPQNADAGTQATRQMYVDAILTAQLSDGGWNFTGESADPDLTAMALQALAKYQEQSAVKAAVNRALVCLSAMQNVDGGFSSWDTENAESCAQAILALVELGIGVDDTRFVKDGGSVLDALLSYQNADGGFCHTHGGETNLMASEQAACALASFVRAGRGETSLYRMAALAGRAAA